jgi:hypothetical protein
MGVGGWARASQQRGGAQLQLAPPSAGGLAGFAPPRARPHSLRIRLDQKRFTLSRAYI